MKWKRLVCMLRRVSLYNFILYNFFSKKVKRNGKGFIVPYKGTVLDLEEGARIILYDGNFYINNNKPLKSKAETIVKLRKNACLVIHQNTFLNYRATIEIHEEAVVEIGSAYINTDTVILAAKKIQIGYDVQMARGVIVFDSDHHDILDENGNKTNMAKDVIIGDHVWIGLKSILLRGTKIGKGSVIAAGSLVGGKIKEGTMGFGSPARSFSNVIWRT